MSKATETKAQKYLTEGKVWVVSHGTNYAVFKVQGSDPDPYRVQFHGGVWSCDCPARVECAHLIAVRLVSRLENESPSFGQPNQEFLDLLHGRIE